MNDFANGFIRAIKTYLKMLPLIIIPLAGLVLMTTVAPYYAVSKGCSELVSNEKHRRLKLALLFSLTLSTILSMILLIISYIISPSLMLKTGEFLIIGVIYILFLFFSSLGGR